MDCLEGMKLIPDKSIDMILCDLPYGTTQNKWDSIINVEELWKQYKRIIKDNGAIILFGQDKFTAMMMMSQPKLHRYNLIWDKVLPSGVLNANRMPLRSHEDIMVFYKKLPKYTPQKVKGKKNHSKGTMNTDVNNNYGEYGKVDNTEALGDMKHPRSILKFDKPHPSVSIHPTQKSVELFEWLINSFTEANQIVLDSCMGSGTTAVACVKNNRKWLGFETEKEYIELANKRLEQIQLEDDLNKY